MLIRLFCEFEEIQKLAVVYGQEEYQQHLDMLWD